MYHMSAIRRVFFQAPEGRTRTDTDFSITDETSLFFRSCKFNDVNIVRQLLAADRQYVQAERKGTTPLHVAARAGSTESIALILQTDPSAANVQDCSGFTPFARAAESGRVEAMRQLLAVRPESIQDRDDAMFTPLHRSAGNGHVEATKFLLDMGANINETDSKLVETPLFHACRIGSADVVRLLVERGANVNVFNAAYSSCLFTAVLSLSEDIGKSAEVLEILLKHGAKPDVQNNFSDTPLSFAVKLKCKRAIVILLRNGANPEFAPYGARAPLEDVLVNNKVAEIEAFKEGLGEDAVKDKLCKLSSNLDPYYIVGKSLEVLNHGRGFCVEAYRPILGLFGPVTHTVRFMDSGEEKSMVLQRPGVDGVRFYLISDQNFETPLLPSTSN